MSSKEEIREKKRWTTPIFRVSHPHLFKPSKIKEGAAEYYSVEMLFPKAEVTKKEIETSLLAAVREKWGDSQADWPKALKLPYRDGDKPHGKKKEVKPEHKGMWVVKASTKAEYGAPAVIGPKKVNGEFPALKQADLYPGCFARASVMASAYENPEKDGVSFILDGVQKFKDGDALGGKKPVDQMFGSLEGDDEAPADDNAFDGLGDADDGEETF